MKKASVFRRDILNASLLVPLLFVTQTFSQAANAEGASLQVTSNITISTNNTNSRNYNVGDDLDFKIEVKKPLYLHCFYASKDGIQNFTPKNLYSGEYANKPIIPSEPIVIGGGKAGYPLGKDKVTCIGSTQPIAHKLPANMSNLDLFQKVEYSSMKEVYQAFKNAVSSKLVYQSITLNIVDVANKS